MCVCTHRAAIDQGFDVRVGLVAQLLLVGASEVQCPAVAVLGALVGPRHRTVAVVREALVSLHTQETQEAQLDNAHWLTVGVHVRELGGGGDNWEYMKRGRGDSKIESNYVKLRRKVRPKQCSC